MPTDASNPRCGSIQLPLLFALALVLLVGFRVGANHLEAVVARKAVFAADAVATAGVYLLRPMEYTPPALEAPLSPAARLDILSRMARVNGIYPELFSPMAEADISAGPVSLAVTLRPLDPDMAPFTGEVHGIPAPRMSGGRVWTNELGQAIAATGVLPLGVQAAALPVNDPVPVDLALGGVGEPLSFLQWSSSLASVVPHLESLGYTFGAAPAGVPPPALDEGATVSRLVPAQPMVDALQALHTGRVVLLPVLNGDTVAGFARVRVHLVTATAPHQVRLGLAPSAAARCALAPAQPRNLPVPSAASIEAFGRVLRPWRGV